jgi:hypothetical protein
MVLSCLLYVMHYPLYFHVFMHLHLASHIGTLAEMCEGNGVGAKPEDGVDGSIPKVERSDEC